MDGATAEQPRGSIDATVAGDHTHRGGGRARTAACGSASTATSGGTGNTGKIGGKLLIDNESGATWTCQFNPVPTLR